MAKNSGIEWCDHTFNPWIGCTEVSPACDHCYARVMMQDRYHRVEWGDHPRLRTSANNWSDPIRWNRAAALTGVRQRVFCASLADVFDNQVDPRWREDLWWLIGHTPALDWLLLTKRPQNIGKMLPTFDEGPAWPWPNVWLGTTVENQEEADRRIPQLLAVPATKRFLSCEPLLGPLDLTALKRTQADGFMRPLDGRFNRIDWIIAGGESGPGARPMHPDWARGLRDQSAAAAVPFFFKQWGEWAINDRGHPIAGLPTPENRSTYESARFPDGPLMNRVGKKAAGVLLDGVEHRAFPS